MTGPLIRKEDGFYTSDDKARPTYPNHGQYLSLIVPKWTLRSSIRTGDFPYDKHEKPWELWQTRKGDKYLRDEQLPLGFLDDRSIMLTAEPLPGKYLGYAVIEEAGTRGFKGRYHLQISGGDEAHGYVRHWPPTDDGPDFGTEQVHFVFVVPREQMTWLRDQLAHQPDAQLDISFRAAAYQHEGQAIGSRYWDEQTYHFEPDTFTPITDFTITVLNEQVVPPQPEPEYEDDFDDPDASLSDPVRIQREQSFALLTQVGLLSKRIQTTQIGLWIIVALLVCILLFKGN